VSKRPCPSRLFPGRENYVLDSRATEPRAWSLQVEEMNDFRAGNETYRWPAAAASLWDCEARPESHLDSTAMTQWMMTDWGAKSEQKTSSKIHNRRSSSSWQRRRVRQSLTSHRPTAERTWLLKTTALAVMRHETTHLMTSSSTCLPCNS